MTLWDIGTLIVVVGLYLWVIQNRDKEQRERRGKNGE